MINRRNFLGFAAAAGVVVDPIPAASAEMSVEQRARHHWAEFAKAMNEIAVDADRWAITGGGFTVNSAGQKSDWLRASTIHLEKNPGCHAAGERHKELRL